MPLLGLCPSHADFEVERIPRVASRKNMPTFDADEMLLKSHVSTLLAAKNKVFSASGRIPLDPSHLNLFFRSKSGITHSLDFPIDPTFNTPPALDVLIAACRPHPAADDVDDFVDRESLFYPPNLPLTATLELSNHPILDAVRSTLFPNLSSGNYLNHSPMAPQPRALRNDGRCATIIVVLPVRYRGGALVIRDIDGSEERFSGRGGKSGDMEWVAFTSDAEYEVETYAVFTRSFGPSGPDPLVHPSDAFLDKVSPILNSCRGQRIAFHLSHDYGVDPSDALAESIVPLLKGGDSMLYHAFKLFKLSPELHYFAGGFMWPVDMTVELLADDSGGLTPSSASLQRSPMMVQRTSSHKRASSRGRTASVAGSTYGDGNDDLRAMVEASGASHYTAHQVNILTDPATTTVGREKVYFVGDELEILRVHVLLIVFVP
ncbi:hypothetical protein DL96DRAFT_1669786 [Flagelloscypha sp. PMI_526]|nr:hypothetical protein DL96DRAFT_1669786 [Flagelloscypha sp. PMI_526]